MKESTGILWELLLQLWPKLTNYIHERIGEGYAFQYLIKLTSSKWDTEYLLQVAF